MPRVPEHVVAERRRRLADLLGRERYLPVGDLAVRMGVSAATARRDLAALQGQSRVTRTFGGAVAAGPPAGGVEEFDARFASYAERAGHAAAAKRRIAKAAASLVRPGMTLFLDAGTTVGAFADALCELPPRRLKNVTVVTHSLPVAGRLAGNEAVETHLLGGRLLGRQMIAVGDAARRALSAFDVDLACLGCEAANAGGIFNSHAEVVRLQRHAALRASGTLLLLDATKLGGDAPERLLLPAEIDRVATDAKPAALAEAGLDVDAKQVVRA